MQLLARYIALQIPGWVVAALVLAGMWHFHVISGLLALALLGVLVAKDAALYPMARRAMVSPAHSGAEALVGRDAVTMDRLAPRGRVRVGAEHWHARTAPDVAPIGEGTPVRIEGVDGLTVVVRPSGEVDAR